MYTKGNVVVNKSERGVAADDFSPSSELHPYSQAAAARGPAMGQGPRLGLSFAASVAFLSPTNCSILQTNTNHAASGRSQVQLTDWRAVNVVLSCTMPRLLCAAVAVSPRRPLGKMCSSANGQAHALRRRVTQASSVLSVSTNLCAVWMFDHFGLLCKIDNRHAV